MLLHVNVASCECVNMSKMSTLCLLFLYLSYIAHPMSLPRKTASWLEKKT